MQFTTVAVKEQQQPSQTMEGLGMPIPPVVSPQPQLTEGAEPQPDRAVGGGLA